MRFDMKFNKSISISILIVITSVFWSRINHNTIVHNFSVGFPYNFIFYHSTTLPLNRFQFLNPLLFHSILEIQIFTFILDVFAVYFIFYCLLSIKKIISNK